MALKTNVPIMYRTPYIPKTHLPPDVAATMRKEVTSMRKNLLNKQQRLRESTEFSHDPMLTRYLKGLKVRSFKTDRQIQNEWSRLRSLQLSNKTSISGKRETAKRTVNTLRERGLSNINISNLGKFGEFVNWVKETYGINAYSSSDVEEYFQEAGDISAEELQRGYEKWLETH